MFRASRVIEAENGVFPHVFRIAPEMDIASCNYVLLDEVTAWCTEQFGEEAKVTAKSIYGAWRRYGRVFMLAHATDATAFKLRWF